MVKANPLIIDCQVFQSLARERGMGKYSLAFISHILDSPELKSRTIYFIFNSGEVDTLPLREQLSAISPNAEFFDLQLEAPKVPREDNSIQPTRLKNKEILDKFFHKRFGDMVFDFLIPALYLDEVCPVFPDSCKGDKLLIYYDSIPYLYHERYGQFKGFFDHFFLPHTATVFEATKILTISQTVANDLHIYFGLPPERIFNIDGASIPRSIENSVKPKGFEVKKNQYVLMPSGQELRKNNTRAVEGFKQFAEESEKKIVLVITSYFTEQAKDELKNISDRIIFTDNVTEGELLWLYENCKFVFFASEYEGLGLPVLEAVDQNKLVACSDISVFREMSKRAFYYFDPLDLNSISDALKKIDLATNDNYTISDEYLRIKEKYSWGKTSQEFVKALGTKNNGPSLKKKKIAILCPDPSGFSAIGKVVSESHAYYASIFDIDYYFDRGPNHIYVRPNFLKYLSNCYDVEEFNDEKYNQYEAVIYHIGNSEYHLNTVRAALASPGYVVLHDTNLGGLFHNLLDQGFITKKRFEAEVKMDMLATKKNGIEKYSTFLTSVINNQKAIITHSEYAKQAVKAKLIRNISTQNIGLPVDVPIFIDVEKRANQKKVTIAFAGIIAKIKGLDIIEEIALSEEFTDCKINIFGFSVVEPDQLERLRYLPHVLLTTNPTDFEFQQLMSETDVLINVRLAYRGETSLTTLEHMRFGGITIVRNFGWYSELPNDAVIKVAKPEDSLPALRSVLDNKYLRDTIHKKAITYIQSEHSHKNYAFSMYDLINSTSKA